MKNWRLITDDGVSASFGLAADEAIASRVGKGLSPPTLRLYTYRSHCALVGRFQNLDQEIQLGYCLQNDVQINRRPTGGGAIIMGGDQLGVALMIPAQGENTHSSTRELMSRFSAGLVAALNELGITAAFQRKNDLEVNGKKIAGLGIYRDPSGGLLFHASLLVDLDIAQMLRILITPFEKISDKEIDTVANRITTVRKETGGQILLNEVRQQIASGYAEVFEVYLEHQDFSHDERLEIARLEHEKYLTNNWIFQTTEVPDKIGLARKKTPAGLFDIRVAMAGRIIKAIYLCGDFFISENTVADIEAGLKWHASEPAEIEKTLHIIYQKHATELDGIPLQTMKSVIQAAVENASAQEGQEIQPYGCFVAPGGGYA